MHSQVRQFLYVTSEEQVLFKAIALRLPHREIIYVTLRSMFGSGRYGGPIRDLYEHFWFGASALGFPNREVLIGDP